MAKKKAAAKPAAAQPAADKGSTVKVEVRKPFAGCVLEPKALLGTVALAPGVSLNQFVDAVRNGFAGEVK